MNTNTPPTLSVERWPVTVSSSTRWSVPFAFPLISSTFLFQITSIFGFAKARSCRIFEVPPLDALESGVVLDQVGVEELTTGGATLDRDGLEHAAAGVHGCGESRRARAHDDHVVAAA